MSIDLEYNAYTREDIPDLEYLLIEAEKNAKQRALECYHKDRYSNSYKREAHRIRKLIDLIMLCDIVEDYDKGLALIDKKFVVSLSSNSWRVLGKGKWYMHKNDLNHFVDNYINKDKKI